MEGVFEKGCFPRFHFINKWGWCAAALQTLDNDYAPLQRPLTRCAQEQRHHLTGMTPTPTLNCEPGSPITPIVWMRTLSVGSPSRGLTPEPTLAAGSLERRSASCWQSFREKPFLFGSEPGLTSTFVKA